MTGWPQHKVRSDQTWAEVRRCWEAGETGASVARRYEVGLANLWRRRASESWSRERDDDPLPEPPEGWRRFAAARLERWEDELEATRALAMTLAAAMRSGPVADVPVWRLGWLYEMRAKTLGEAVAVADRARAKDQPWATVFWDAEGRLLPLRLLDRETLRLFREDWRREAGLPDGAAENWP